MAAGCTSAAIAAVVACPTEVLKGESSQKGHGYILRANAGQKNMARNGGKSTSGIRIRHRLSSKWTTKAAREQKRGHMQAQIK